ncbi:uridine kinase [Spiroplasma sabaudiense Ar-1343]|uniref:Uridine kinase n=1 Tax=Spiroplasma sabaudiense Ar-1343 TaxID=1276257 RepID=W6AA51_9MOLU|nr:uridine kinase [Spiroplasma sabaudiense]AHI53942.1 uridine kinase [Spiroplasma sabaudiense Ar-1343]
MKNKKTNIIIISGGSASGKTTVAKRIANDILKDESVINLSMDSYYKDFKNLSQEEAIKINFDHPDSIDVNLLVEDLNKLKSGQAIEAPVYDFTTSSRLKITKHIEPADVIILDGILALHIEKIREMGDIKIFIRTHDDIRLIRRLTRDMKDYGRKFENIIEKYLETVRPMHEYFVEPSIKYADIIIPYYEGNEVAVDLIATKIFSLLKK